MRDGKDGLLNTRIVECTAPRDFLDVQSVHRRVWGLDDLETLPVHVISASVKAGACVLCAYTDGEPVGFLYSMMGWDRRRNRPFMYIHNLGVVANFEGNGIGLMIMRYALSVARRSGVASARWAFDPLVSRNASLYLNRVGAVVSAYEPDYWGEMNDEVNRGIGSDRLLVEVALDSDESAGERPSSPPSDNTCAAPALNATTLVLNSTTLAADGRLYPEQCSDLMLTDMACCWLLAVPADLGSRGAGWNKWIWEWRLHLRTLFSQVLSHELAVVGFRRTGGALNYYVVQRP